MRCGAQSVLLENHKALRCSACGFTYFHNVATAVGAIIVCGDEVLLLERGKEPGKGQLGLPGGFVDPFESAEQALIREISEETGIRVTQPLNYVGAWANQYPYGGVLYHTQDVYFEVALASKPSLTLQVAEVRAAHWVAREQIDLNQLAFCSARDALQHWLAG